MSQADPKAQAAEAWRAGAAGWIRNADFIDGLSVPVREWIVERLDPQPGQTILELATGGGDTGFQIAQKLGSDGRLIATDIAEGMLEGARKRAEQRGISNVEFRVMDAQAIDLPDASIDGVVHRYGPMLLPEADASFAGARRVLKPGGRYACAVWAGPERNPWIPAGGMALMQHGVQPPEGDPFGPGGMFSFADAEVLKQRISAAGFDVVEVESVQNPFAFASFDDFWKIPSEIAGPLATIIAGLDREKAESVKQSFREMVEPFRSGDEYRPPAVTHCAIAR